MKMLETPRMESDVTVKEAVKDDPEETVSDDRQSFKASAANASESNQISLYIATSSFISRRDVAWRFQDNAAVSRDLNHLNRALLNPTDMSFVFRGTRADIESGFPEFIPERRAMRVHASRSVNSNSLAFLVTVITNFCVYVVFPVLLLFMILNSHQMSPNFLVLSFSERVNWFVSFTGQLWPVLGVFLMATTLRMYATCQQLQAQAQAHAAAASGLLGHTEMRLHVPPSIALATRGRLQGLRLQLALLDREFDDLDYETLRALDSDNVPAASSMSEEEINALPVHKYKKKQETANTVGSTKASEDELTCSVCLEQVNVGELIRSLPCMHQFHASCIDPWLRQQGTCPVCKFRAGSVGWHENGQGGMDPSYMV
ncbi:RING/U-box superfamily protein [Prunus dulcis]|uniref:RING-type E3 ubiquitin transferase n=1 Tax=Prunus dulcis TaxID=3755 RepID=A0A4Y1R1M2_PRUDU|nr:RING/U-box superfamily protein [Prunus dulcis]